MSTFNVITSPSSLTVSVAEMEAQMRVDLSSETALITAKINAAIEYCEHKSGKAFITQTIEMRFDTWADAKGFVLMRSPVQSVDFIKYYDKDNNLVTVDASTYIVENSESPARIILGYNKTWGTTDRRPGNSIIIQYVAGYGNASTDVPARYREAVKLLAAHYYENREATTSTSTSANASVSVIPYGIDQLLRTGKGGGF